MENAIRSQIKERYRLETSVLRLERQRGENAQALKQAKFDLRAAQEQQLLYQGSLRSFLDRVSGKKEEKETALRHGLRKAEAELNTARRERDVLERQLQDIHAQLEVLPSPEALREQAAAYPEAKKEWCRQEARCCMEAAGPLLEENHAALM